jgi:hypothetical protein
MKNPVIIASMLPFSSIGISHSIFGVLSINDAASGLTQPEAQVISSVIAVIGSFGVAYFMNWLNTRRKK